jgi:hypothetical protein
MTGGADRYGPFGNALRREVGRRGKNNRIRVALRSLGFEHFGLLDEPHRQRQEALLKKTSLFNDVIEEAKAMLQGKGRTDK